MNPNQHSTVFKDAAHRLGAERASHINPNQLALANKNKLEARGIYIVEPDGRVRITPERGGGYVPPWSWAGTLFDGEDIWNSDGTVKKPYNAFVTPAGDPSSAWHWMHDDGGPFTNRSEWDSTEGTYEGGINVPNLLGTIGVGGLFAAPAIAGALWAGSAGAGAGTGAGIGAGETAAALGLPAGAAGLPGAATVGSLAVPAAGTSAAAIGAGATLPSTAIAPTTGTLAGGAASGAVPAAFSSGGASMAGGIGGSGIGWGDVFNVGLNYLGSRQAAGAAQDAANAQLQFGQKALDENARQYDISRQDYLANRDFTRQQMQGLNPYMQLGTSTFGNLGRLTGNPSIGAIQPQQPMNLGTAGGGMRVGTGQQGLPRAQLVTVQGPDGSTRQVPPQLAQIAIAQGAKVLNG